MTKAAEAGTLLADIIARTPGPKKYVLMGHSLGARVVYYTLRSLAGGPVQRIKAAHLLGGAVGTGSNGSGTRRRRPFTAGSTTTTRSATTCCGSSTQRGGC